MTVTDARLLDVPSAASERRAVDGVELHVVTAGDPADPLVVLLHGFPDFWYGWARQVPALVDAGFRVLVPDQRGYNLSDKPAGLDAYRLGRLSGDVAALVAAEGRESAHVVGHDWGGGVAWDLAARRPGTVDRVAVVNAPHPAVMRATVTADPRQLLRSWYVLLFQVPRLPEWLLARDDAAAVVAALERGSRPGAFTDADLERYRAAWRREGAPGGALNWYRAALRRRDDPPRAAVDPPTLVVWGDDDAALDPRMADMSLAYCADGRLERVPGGTHWVHRERPGRVTDRLLDHFEG